MLGKLKKKKKLFTCIKKFTENILSYYVIWNWECVARNNITIKLEIAF